MFDPNLASLEGNVELNEETVRQFYRVDTRKMRKVGRFKAQAVDYRIVVRPLDPLLRHHGPSYDVVQALLNSVFTAMRDGVQPHDRIGMIIDGGGLNAPVWIPLMRNDQFSIERVMLAVEGVL